MNFPRFFITANHTGAGKTLAAAVVTKALGAKYWKPIQTGSESDTQFVAQMLGASAILSEPAYSLPGETSPHNAANVSNTMIDVRSLVLPASECPLVVEGAGGWLSPVTRDFLMADLAKQLHCSVILVIDHYLGGINHALLSLRAIEQHALPFAGIIYNHEDVHGAESVISAHHSLPVLLRIPNIDTIDEKAINGLAQQVQLRLQK